MRVSSSLSIFTRAQAQSRSDENSNSQTPAQERLNGRRLHCEHRQQVVPLPEFQLQLQLPDLVLLPRYFCSQLLERRNKFPHVGHLGLAFPYGFVPFSRDHRGAVAPPRVQCCRVNFIGCADEIFRRLLVARGGAVATQYQLIDFNNALLSAEQSLRLT
jgi:hypothetical protein